METRFVPFAELKRYFEKQELEEDIEEKSNLGICSVGDLLYITEDYKKNTLKSSAEIEIIFNQFKEGPVASGQIQIAELDRERLSETMFEELSENEEIVPWRIAASSKISPRDSITYLSLRITPNTWWSAEVFEQMAKNITPSDEE